MWNLLIGVKGLCNNPSVSLRLPAPFSREPKVKASLEKGGEPPLGGGGIFCEIFCLMCEVSRKYPSVTCGDSSPKGEPKVKAFLFHSHVRFPIHIAARCSIMLDYRMDTFLSLCETKSYTKTAAILHLTQPSVTQHIKYLEHFYQCPLFHYDGKQVEMTEAGQYLRDKVILQRAQNVEIRKRLQQMQEPISFDIGLTPSATFSFALPRLCTYVNRNAEPRIQFHVSNTRRLLRGMQNGMLDAIIMEGEIPDMLVEATELCRENIIAAASPELSEELYGCTWSTLLKQPLIVLETGCGIRTLVQRHLSRSGISLYDFREVIEVDSFIVLKELLRQGLGIAFVLEPTIQQERDEKRLGRIYVDTMPMYGSLYFVTMRDRADNEQLWKIRDVLLQKTFSAGN